MSIDLEAYDLRDALRKAIRAEEVAASDAEDAARDADEAVEAAGDDATAEMITHADHLNRVYDTLMLKIAYLEEQMRIVQDILSKIADIEELDQRLVQTEAKLEKLGAKSGSGLAGSPA